MSGRVCPSPLKCFATRNSSFFPCVIHGEQLLKEFNESLTLHHPTIKFTAIWSAESVAFWYTTVYLKEDVLIGTDLYVKPTDKYQYLRMNSCHPLHWKASISFNQACDSDEICWDDRTYDKITREFKQYFLSLGYNEQHLKKEFNSVLSLV